MFRGLGTFTDEFSSPGLGILVVRLLNTLSPFRELLNVAESLMIEHTAPRVHAWFFSLLTLAQTRARERAEADGDGCTFRSLRKHPFYLENDRTKSGKTRSPTIAYFDQLLYL